MPLLILGIALLVAGVLIPLHILYIIGAILAVVGVIMLFVPGPNGPWGWPR